MSIRNFNYFDLLARYDRIKNFFSYYFGGIYNRVSDHHTFLMAGGLAFSLFVCIVPLVLMVFSLVGVILEKPTVAGEIETFIDRAIPYADYAAFVKDKVFARVDEFRLFKNWAGIVGFVGLLFAASGLFSSMRTILNTVFKTGQDESAWLGKLRDFMLIIIVALYFLLTTLILPALEVFSEFAKRVAVLEAFRIGIVENLILGVISFLLIFVTFMMIYWLIPYGKPPRRVIVVSSLFAAVLWETARQLFGIYLSHAVNLKMVYGAYALIVVVAFWIYYSAVVFIVGAEIGQLYRERNLADDKPVIDFTI
jgi:membrane protein